MSNLPATNFAFLKIHDEQLSRLGMLAERYFATDANTCLLKLRQLTDLLAQFTAFNTNLLPDIGESYEESQYQLIRRLQDRNILPREIFELFDQVRRAGNAASHAGQDDHSTALITLRLTWQLALWFHRTFKDPTHKSGPFVPPSPPKDESDALRKELERLNAELHAYEATHQETASRLQGIEAALQQARDDQAFWEQMAKEAEEARVRLEKQLAERKAEETTPAEMTRFVKRARSAAEKLQLDETETRKLIDAQLRQAGWEADTAALSYGKGARPERGKNRAIAEWPTSTGPADYLLCIGLMPVATLEAKRKNADVSAAIQQAKRYSRSFNITSAMTAPGGPWGDFVLPFAFSANGRPFLRQLATGSGIWFVDLRRPHNQARALDGWHSPDGLQAMLKQNEDAAHTRLRTESFQYGFALRDYQKSAIRAIEAGIVNDERAMLVAMATGTGKTKTCIALIYRLLKVQRFQRVLFLVDRSALGEQAADAFKETRMENLQTFADTFGIKELREKELDSGFAFSVHIATVQSMVQRVLHTPEGQTRPTVDQYDCIVVDECHRGYLLDRELSDQELTFRDQDDYVSQYRRVLDYFDAVKIGLTATPALHTTEIFGPPIFTYSYREAVIDGFLIDHEPPINIHTELSKQGIRWKKGEEIKAVDAASGEVSLFKTPDEIKIEVDGFNRKVITSSYNEVVCDFLATEIDPSGRQKTLIFCVNDRHADLVVALLKEAFVKRYGAVDDDAVLKITGKADKPLALIRRYKNEQLPNVAVTVDLLSTGIDVPEICNIVFRVTNRILFDQMLGRATRLCPEVNKEAFRIFDAVQIYDALQGMTAMQPVVTDPKIGFTQMAAEMVALTDDEGRRLVRDQFLVKLQRKRSHLSEQARQEFEQVTGLTPEKLIAQLKSLPLPEAATWFQQHPTIGTLLDTATGPGHAPVLISEHTDSLYSVERGYGQAQKPEDYLSAFATFLRENQDRIPALTTVLTRPRDLTRKQLRELAMELDRAGFTETNLSIAWRETTNQEIAARIVGYIRKAALNETLLPYEQRVDRALQRILASKPWTTPQRQWLQRIAAQTKANVVVDREMLDDEDLLFKREGGGFQRLDRLFNGELATVLDAFHEEIWALVA